MLELLSPAGNVEKLSYAYNFSSTYLLNKSLSTANAPPAGTLALYAHLSNSQSNFSSSSFKSPCPVSSFTLFSEFEHTSSAKFVVL